MDDFPRNIGNFMIQSDELIFFRGVESTNQIKYAKLQLEVNDGHLVSLKFRFAEEKLSSWNNFRVRRQRKRTMQS